MAGMGEGGGKPGDDRADVRALLAALGAEDADVLRDLLRENPALAESVLGKDELVQAMRSLLTESSPAQAMQDVGAPMSGSPSPDDVDQPGLFTDLARSLSPEQAEQLYRKVVPLVVYEILRTLDRLAHVGAVQQMVDHLCSQPVQARLRRCAHVRDGILDELCAILRDRSPRTKLDRDAVLKIMHRCGVMGELTTLVNCVRLIQAQAG